MKNYAIIPLLLLDSLIIFAQKELPAFGKIDKADLLLKECEYDKDAEAYNLLAYGDVHYFIAGEDFNIETQRRVRIKILKEKGISQANIKIRFLSFSGYESIKNISAYTYNLDNAGDIVATKVDKSSIYSKKINNKVSEISFSMPNVKIGSVIEYKYTDLKKSIRDLDDWYFQDDIPTRISLYKIMVPSIFQFTSKMITSQPVEQKSDDRTDLILYQGNQISSHSMEKIYLIRNVPALRDEPYMRSSKDYLQRVEFQLSQINYPNGEVKSLMTTWKKLTEDLLGEEDFGSQLKKNLPHTKSLDDSLKNVQGDYNKMVVIHDYVRRNMNWNGSETIYSFDGIKSAWDKKSGNNAELNFILIDLLRDAGLKAYPLLVSTKDNGSVNSIYPFLQQFNNTMTCVFIDNKRYILNGADKYNPSYLIPYDVVNNEAFIVDLEKGGWITLSDEKNIWKNVVSYLAEITPEAIMKGHATVYNYNYSKNPRVKRWKEDNDDYKDYFSSVDGIKIDSLQVSNAEINALPLTQKLDFSLPVNSSGEYEYFTLNLFQGLEKNPFIADKRRTDIDFNYKQSYMLVGKIFIPDNFQFEELPKNIKMILPDSSIIFQRVLQVSESSIDFRINLDFLSSYYAAEDYPNLQGFYKKLFTILNEQIVIKKKKTNS